MICQVLSLEPSLTNSTRLSGLILPAAERSLIFFKNIGAVMGVLLVVAGDDDVEDRERL